MCLPRLEGTLKILYGNVSQEHCIMFLDVFYGLSMLSFQLFSVGEARKIARCQVGIVRGMREHQDVAPDHKAGKYEGCLAAGIVMVELDCVFDVSPCTWPSISISWALPGKRPSWQFSSALKTRNGWFLGCQRRQHRFDARVAHEHPGLVTGYERAKKVGLVLNQIQQSLTERNSFFLIFYKHFRHNLRTDIAHLQILSHCPMYWKCERV